MIVSQSRSGGDEFTPEEIKELKKRAKGKMLPLESLDTELEKSEQEGEDEK